MLRPTPTRNPSITFKIVFCDESLQKDANWTVNCVLRISRKFMLAIYVCHPSVPPIQSWGIRETHRYRTKR